MSEQEILEEQVELALQTLRSTDSLSPFKRTQNERKLKASLNSLKNEFPDSYVLEENFDLSV